MKKTIACLLIAGLGANFAFAQPKPRRPLPPKEVAEEIKQALDAGEITKEEAKQKMEVAIANIEKPKVLSDDEKRSPKEFADKIHQAVKDGKLSKDEAKKKLEALRGEMEKKGQFKRPKRPAKPELSDAVKDSLAEIKADQQKLHESMKAKLADLGEGASKEKMREAIEAFKTDNKEKFDAIKQAHDAIRESIESARPEKPERPELSGELKVKVEALKEKHQAMHTARKELHQQLKEASKEEKEELISAFKETNKEKHKEIKTQSKEIKEEIRALVEIEATRTSDL